MVARAVKAMMPISATGTPRNNAKAITVIAKAQPTVMNGQSGLSLLETLVALSIIAVMATTVVVTADFGRSQAYKRADTLVRALAEANQESLVSGQIIGFAVDPDGQGYRFFRFSNQSWSEFRNHPAFDSVRVEPNLQLSIVEGAIEALEVEENFLQTETLEASAPQIWFDAGGFNTHFHFRLTSSDGEQFEIKRNEAGGIFLEQANQSS
jgi:type II secretion system protein H